MKFRPVVPSNYLSNKQTLTFQINSHSLLKSHPGACANNVWTKRSNSSIHHRSNVDEWDEESEAILVLYGRTVEGYSVSMITKVYPILCLQLQNKSQIEGIYALLSKRNIQVQGKRFKFLKKFSEFCRRGKSAEHQKFPVVFLAFKSMMDYWSARAIFSVQNPKFDTSKHFRERQTQRKYLEGPKKCQGISGVVEVCERSVSQVLIILDSIGVGATCIVDVDLSQVHCSDDKSRVSSCDLELSGRLRPFGQAPFMTPSSLKTCFPFVIHSFDLEACLGPDRDRGFPEAHRAGDKIISICSVTKNIGTGKELHIVHGLEDYTVPEEVKKEGIVYYSYPSELELLEGWRDSMLHDEDPDILTGFNIDGFDWGYINARVTLLFPDSRFFFFGRLVNMACKLEEKTFNSDAFGTKTSAFFDSAGRINFDVFTFICRNMNLDSYSLKNVSKVVLKNKTLEKEDLAYQKMFDYWKGGDPKLRYIIHRYCLQDALLPLRIIEARQMIFTQVEMSRVVSVSIKDLLERGQTVKVLSNIYRRTRQNGFFMSNPRSNNSNAAYKGATVLTCSNGFHEKVAVLDFASLYPSIMIAYNICPSTLVILSEKGQKVNEVPTEFECHIVQTGNGRYAFNQTSKGLVPELLEDLLSARKVAKKDMNKAYADGDTVLGNLMNARQIALKVTCNSIYGYFGAVQFNQYACVQVAAAVTAMGRNLIERTVQISQKDYPMSVIYG
jgi:DNA polymerase elongation subunit (family B)